MGEFDWNNLWQKFKIPLVLGLVGIFLVSVGILTTLFLSQQKEPEIEVLPTEEEKTTIFIDLGGAVEKPGLYELPVDSRINDLLARAGGLAAEADREWVEKNLNLAQELSDGVKIYIPSEGETVGEESGKVAGASASIVGKININTASTSELDTLWGIGEARAKAIITNRPYSSINELLSKKIIPSNVFERIKDEISVF